LRTAAFGVRLKPQNEASIAHIDSLSLAVRGGKSALAGFGLVEVL